MEIVDLHCDLLLYLAENPHRSPSDPESRCSVTQLEKGGVKKQVLAIFADYPAKGEIQLQIFEHLKKEYPERGFIAAFEGGTGFAEDKEPLDAVFLRLDKILCATPLAYISLTWNGENRFGGGCGSSSGLKADGKELLQFLSGKGVALDLSHASDRLARESLEYLDEKNLNLKVMASHSNLRSIVDQKRNLPDDIAKEIIAREGLIGLVFYNHFLGSPENLPKMIEYGLQLGGEKSLAFGADFFCTEDGNFPSLPGGGFFEDLSNASCYPSIIKKLSLSPSILEGICAKNSERFLLDTQQQHSECH